MVASMGLHNGNSSSSICSKYLHLNLLKADGSLLVFCSPCPEGVD